MAKQTKVTAACVVVTVDGQERYVYRGSLLPSGVDRKDITRLRNNGLVAEVDVPEADSAQDIAESEAKAAADKVAAEKAESEKVAAEKAGAAKSAGRAAPAK